MTNNFIVIDIETTGNTNQEILTYSELIYSDSKLVNTKVLYGIPEEKILPGAIAVHGMSEFHIDKTTALSQSALLVEIFKSLVHNIQNFNNGYYLVGYNHKAFDLAWIKHNMLRYFKNEEILAKVEKLFKFLETKAVDVFLLVKKLYKQTDLGDLKLSTIYINECCKTKEDIDNLINDRAAHNSTYDCKITADVLLALMQKLDLESIAEVMSYINKPKLLKTMSFGKYKDKTFEEIIQTDPSYVKWLTSPEVIKKNPDIAYTIKYLIDKQNEDLF